MPDSRSVFSEDVTFSSGTDDVRAYLAAPSRAISGPAIVLIPDVHGLSDLYRSLASNFAERGIAALAIDLYSREGAPKLRDAVDAMRWIAALPDRRILGDVQAALDWLHAERGTGAKSVGVTGFCMGGQYALLAACTLRGVAACVSFYGMLRYHETNERKPKSPLDAAADLTCPYLGLFGAEDALIPQTDVEELRARLRAAEKAFEIHTYPGCGHAFLNHTRADAYRPDSARDAFERAVAFFHEHLARSVS